MYMNINLGGPYEVIIKKIIEKGYAGNQTEVIRQALMTYEREIEEEEVQLVHKAVQLEMQDITQGITKTKTLLEMKKKYNV